jgi:hypothetical protein
MALIFMRPESEGLLGLLTFGFLLKNAMISRFSNWKN